MRGEGRGGGEISWESGWEWMLPGASCRRTGARSRIGMFPSGQPPLARIIKTTVRSRLPFLVLRHLSLANVQLLCHGGASCGGRSVLCRQGGSSSWRGDEKEAECAVGDSRCRDVAEAGARDDPNEREQALFLLAPLTSCRPPGFNAIGSGCEGATGAADSDMQEVVRAWLAAHAA
eukprot:371308-Hanusia_phi.AAC.1